MYFCAAMNIFYSAFTHNGFHFMDEPCTIICTDDGQIIEVQRGIKHKDAIELQGLVCPGFVNAHCHLELSYLYNKIPMHTGLVEFITQVGLIRNAATDQEIQQAIQLAEQQMMDAGIVAVGDICNTINTITQKKKNNLHYHSFVEVAGVLDSIASSRYEAGADLQKQFAQLHPSTIVPHAPYSVSQQLFAAINQTNQAMPISIHHQECAAEDQLIRNANGTMIPFLQHITNQQYVVKAQRKSSTEYVLPMLEKQPAILFVHNTFTTQHDILFAQQHCRNRYWVLCPNANLYIENQLPAQIEFLIDQQETICFGTDSLASNASLNIFREMQTIHQHYPTIPLETLLQWLTANGAEALHMPHLGQIKAGLSPGLINISNWTNNQQLPANPIIQRIM
jgi:aminodeoxyfutalosine deaminase